MKNYVAHLYKSILITLILLLFSATLTAQETKFNSYNVIKIHPGVDDRGLGGLNDSSEVAGGLDDKIFHWADNVINYYPSPYNDICSVTGLNNSSEISGASAGYGLYGDPYDWVAVRWTDGSPTVLGTITGDLLSVAYGLNDQGVAVGYSMDTVNNDSKQSPVIFDNFVYYLGDLIGNPNLIGICSDINDNGVITGTAGTAGTGTYSAFMYSIGSAFTTLNGEGGFGYGINNINQVVGRASSQPVLWNNSPVPTYLEGSGTSWAINDSSIIVGAGFFSSTTSAAIWKDYKIKDLNKLISDDENVLLSRATRINNKNEILCFGKDLNTNEDYYFLLTPDSVDIIKPKADDIFIAGEKDTIKWFSVWDADIINIEYSDDGGETYIPLAQNISTDSCKYIWDVPDDIFSAKCYIKIIDATSLEELKVSDKFGIRPYVLTRTDPTNDELIQYDPLIDMWGFENDSSDVWPEWWWYDRFDYQGIDPYTGMEYPQWIGDSSFFNAIYFYYPDWPSFVRAFSASICYRSIEYGVYNIKAVKKWYSISKDWGGSCFGIAGTNALAFMHRNEFLNKFHSFPYFQNPVSVTSDSGVINAVAELFSHQFGNPSKANDISGNIKTANQTLRDIKSMFRKSNDARTIALINQYGNGAHSILPYKLEKDESLDYIYYLYVYDNSYSYLLDAKIRFDTTGYNNMGTWEPMYGWANWGGNYGIYLEVPSDKYLGYAELEENKRNKSDFDLATNEIEVLCSQGTDILITNSMNEQIGHMNGQLINEMPGAFPLRIKNGTETPPYGYSLSVNTYSIETLNFTKPKTSLDIFTMDKIFTISRQGTSPGQVDKVYYTAGQRIGISNFQTSIVKRFKFSEIISNEQQDKMFIVRNLDMVINDSLDFINPADGQLKVTNIGTGKDYEIELEYADNQKMKRFLNESVDLPSTTSHTLIPDWSDINQNPLIILVDIGNDGTTDDTLEIENQVMGVGEDEGQLIPNEYRLEQNYPNPFNSATVIKYSLPQDGLVTLKVFNIIAEEIITLVEEVKQSGNYQVSFNAGQLPSGVYFYQLRAGEFVQTKKMTLMK